MNSKQFGLTEYNDVILSLYDANPIASVGDSVKKAPESENKSDKPKGPTVRKVGSKSLAKETYKMRLAAVANLKLRKRMFEYEKQRFKQLTVEIGKLSKGDKDTEVKLKKKKKEVEEDKGFNWSKFLRRLFRGMARRLKIAIKRKIPPKWRKKWNNLKRNVQVRSKKFWKNLTRPYRQAGRALQNLPARTFRGVTDLFTDAGRARSLSRTNASYARYIKGTANLGDKFRLLGRGFISPAQALSKGGPGALAQPITPNIFRDSFDQLGKPLEAARSGLATGANFVSDTFQTGKANLIKGTTAATDFLGNQFKRLGNFAMSKGDEALKGTNRWLDDAMAFGGRVVGTLTKWGNVLKDPQTYVKIKNGFVAGVDKLKGAAKALYDDFIAFVAQHPQFKKIVESRIGKKVFSKLGARALGKLLGRLIVGVGTVLAIWSSVEMFAAGDYEGAVIAILGAIPLVGIPFIVIEILRELFPESWEKIAQDITGKTKDERNKAIVEGVERVGTAMEQKALNNPGFGGPIGGGFAEGGLLPAKPQLVLVGEGGEEEFIVPKSKLNYFLGSDAALQVLNAGASAVFSSASEYLKGTGLYSEASSLIPELALGKELPETPTEKFKGKQITKLSVADKIKKAIVDAFTSIWEKIKSLIPKVPKVVTDAAGNLFGGLSNIFLGGPASAATMPPNFNMNAAAIDGTFATGLKTGASQHIGGSSDYHIDTKFSKSLSMEDRVKMMDKLAESYAARGRKIEFSNAAVSGKVWNKNATMEEKLALLQAAQNAHGHSRHSQYDSIDYYIPSTGETRFGKSAEGAEILVPTVEGGKVNYGQGGGYGAFITLTDEKGNVILKTGHGDIRGAKTGSVNISSINKNKPSVGPTPEPDPNFFLKLLNPVAQAQQPQVIPMPLPSPAPSPLALSTPQYQSWGLGILGN